MFSRLLHQKHQFRLMLCGHKAVEAGAVCMVLMVQGNIMGLTLGHLLIASKTGFLAMSPVLAVTVTRYGRLLADRWISSSVLGICALIADAIIHESHYPGEYTEAVLTGIGAFAFSLLISYTPVGKYIDRLAESFIHD
jgi:hypothetical protein